MKKIFLSFGLICTFALFATFSRNNVGISPDRFLTPNVSVLGTSNSAGAEPKSSSNDPVSQTIDTNQRVVPPDAPTPVSGTQVQNSTPTLVIKPKSTGQYTDGSYTGSVADAYYGNIQVKAVVSGEKLSDVVFLQYPNDRQTSIEINTEAMGYLKTEAIKAQSANVDIVSGASDSSQAFIQSLGTALAIAKK